MSAPTFSCLAKAEKPLRPDTDYTGHTGHTAYRCTRFGVDKSTSNLASTADG